MRLLHALPKGTPWTKRFRAQRALPSKWFQHLNAGLKGRLPMTHPVLARRDTVLRTKQPVEMA